MSYQPTMISSGLQIDFRRLSGSFYRDDNDELNPEYDFEPNGYLGISKNLIGEVVAVFSIKTFETLKDKFGHFAKAEQLIFDASHPQNLLGSYFTKEDLEKIETTLSSQDNAHENYSGFYRAMADIKAVHELPEIDRELFDKWVGDRVIGSPEKYGAPWIRVSYNYKPYNPKAVDEWNSRYSMCGD